MDKSIDIVIRELELKDLEDYLYLNHPSREFQKFNGPYYAKKSEAELREYVENLKILLLKGEKNVLKNKKIIANKNTDKIIGEVNWYWKSEETFWMEIGIVIFNDDYWGQGIGYKVLKMWIGEIFVNNPKLIRIGLTTWSGNERMMKLAERIGLKKEAVYRKARIVDNKYYDSVSYGMLKDEWLKLKF
ncbi:GNAT family N-acetyltransferase [Clostridium sp.]|uniref:GNAT family N-acetyltransferase n=1 Tax=Clostridium sp. TaxID=1506 RepID=UPI0026107150|nr:GNAT family protein [uncultured Clostridium sp.]